MISKVTGSHKDTLVAIQLWYEERLNRIITLHIR